jgi:hypothetical protein
MKLVAHIDETAPSIRSSHRAGIPAVGEAGGEVIVVSANCHEAIRLAVDKLAGVVYVGDLRRGSSHAT